MGLQLLDSEIHKYFDNNQLQANNVETVREELVELVADVSQACIVAVDTINDLLLYEKIDGGILVLEPSEIVLGPFVKEVLKLFTVQVSQFSYFFKKPQL